MKICAIICEYNPFHNGHLHHLNAARTISGADAVVCFMSGNFVQRGEAAILDKQIRAKHAIRAGADAVIELPTVFATSNAELFAKGAVHLLSSVPAVDTLCFGAETNDKQAFLKTATLLNDEPASVSKKIRTEMQNGTSYARARAKAWNEWIPESFFSSPNNILGLEYTRALLSVNAKVQILPIQRLQSGYLENTLRDNYSSATAIRANLKDEKIKDNLPDFVYFDLPEETDNRLDALEKYAILSKEKQAIARVCDCTEGLENAFKKAATHEMPLVQSLTSPRYTASRIRRIALQSLLNIEESFIRESLRQPLYLRVLAVKNGRSDVLSALSESGFPLLVRGRDREKLSEIAAQCFETDLFAENVYALLYKCFTESP